MDSNLLVITTPLFMNSILQFLGDYYGFLLTERILNKKAAMIFLSYALFNVTFLE
jgi:hypothetical protein